MKSSTKMHVKNMRSSRGNEVANQFIITNENGKFFQSYDSMIVFISNDGKITLDKTYWDYSKTTGKYRNQFLGENKVETERKIKSGEYELGNLIN